MVPSRILSKACWTPFARDITGDGRIFILSANLIDFVDIDDSVLRFLDIAISGLEELQNNIFDVFSPT